MRETVANTEGATACRRSLSGAVPDGGGYPPFRLDRRGDDPAGGAPAIAEAPSAEAVAAPAEQASAAQTTAAEAAAASARRS